MVRLACWIMNERAIGRTPETGDTRVARQRAGIVASHRVTNVAGIPRESFLDCPAEVCVCTHMHMHITIAGTEILKHRRVIPRSRRI